MKNKIEIVDTPRGKSTRVPNWFYDALFTSRERSSHGVGNYIVRQISLSDGYSFTATQREVAEAVGLSVRHLSRVLSHLRDIGVIKYSTDGSATRFELDWNRKGQPERSTKAG